MALLSNVNSKLHLVLARRKRDSGNASRMRVVHAIARVAVDNKIEATGTAINCLYKITAWFI